MIHHVLCLKKRKNNYIDGKITLKPTNIWKSVLLACPRALIEIPITAHAAWWNKITRIFPMFLLFIPIVSRQTSVMVWQKCDIYQTTLHNPHQYIDFEVYNHIYLNLVPNDWFYWIDTVMIFQEIFVSNAEIFLLL